MGRRSGCLYHIPPQLSTRHRYLGFAEEAEGVPEGGGLVLMWGTVLGVVLIKEHLHNL